jgi:hypothetical protein
MLMGMFSTHGAFLTVPALLMPDVFAERLFASLTDLSSAREN